MKLTQKVLLVYALLVVIGGIMGMVKGSLISLVMAVISAALLLYSRWLWGQKPLAGFILGLVVSLALFGRFVGAAMSKGLEMWPGGVVIFSSVVTIVALIAAFAQERKNASGPEERPVEEEAASDETGKAEAAEAEEPSSSEDA